MHTQVIVVADEHGRSPTACARTSVPGCPSRLNAAFPNAWRSVG